MNLFEMDVFALGLTVFFLVLMLMGLQWKKQFQEPIFFFSNVESLRLAFSNSTKGVGLKYPEKLNYLSLLFFLLAFIDPHFFIKKGTSNRIPQEGIAIYLVADQSGSMKEKIEAIVEGKETKISKTDLLKKVTAEFIKGNPSLDLPGHPHDLIGLIEFARTAHVVVPLTLDHQEILKKLSAFQAVNQMDQDGTATGYAIYKAVNVIAATRYYNQNRSADLQPAYAIKNAIVILVTDGFPDPNPLDQNNPLRMIDPLQAAAYAKEKDVRVFVVVVDPILANDQAFAPHRRLMEKIANMSGGKLYLMNGSSGSLENIYKDLDHLEKSAIPSNLPKDQRPDYHRVSLYPTFIALGMLCMLLSILLESIFLKRVP